MIGWLVDRWWAHKNRADLEQVDQQMEALRLQSESLDRRMEESFGPNWREEAERRLSQRLSCSWTCQ